MTIKTQGGKVITKGGRVSCTCCEPGACDGCCVDGSLVDITVSISGTNSTSGIAGSGSQSDSETSGPSANTCSYIRTMEDDGSSSGGSPTGLFGFGIEVANWSVLRVRQDGDCGWLYGVTGFGNLDDTGETSFALSASVFVASEICAIPDGEVELSGSVTKTQFLYDEETDEFVAQPPTIVGSFSASITIS